MVLLGLFQWDTVARACERITAWILPQGFIVTYFADTDFKDDICRRPERQAMRDYGDDSPAFGVPANSYSARWEAWLCVPEDAEYEFFLQSQGPARFWIGADLVVDKWDDPKWVPGKHGQKELQAGNCHVIIEHVKHSGPGALRLRWAGGPVPDNTIMRAPHVRKKTRNKTEKEETR